MKESKRAILRRLMLWLTTLMMLLSICGVPAYADELPEELLEALADYPGLTPDDLVYEDGNIILHKQAERIGPEEWEVTVKVTVGPKPVEKRKMEVVFVLDCSGSMAWCTRADHELGNHTHIDSGTSSCYRVYSCGKTQHTHSYNNCAPYPRTQCTSGTNSDHWQNGTHVSNPAAGRECVYRYGYYYLVTCGLEAHSHNESGCTYTTYDTPQCGRDECTHSSSGASRCYYTNENGERVYYQTRLEAAKIAINTMVANLTAKNPENVSIKYVIFSSGTSGNDNGVNKPNGQSTMVVDSIANVTAEGGTYMYTGIETGIGQFSDSDFKKVLVVLTDGEANDDSGDAPSLNSFKSPDGTDGTVFTVGFAYDNSVLANIAGNGGSYLHAADADALDLAFEQLEQRLTAMLEDPMGTSVGFTSGSISEIQNTSGVISNNGDIIYWHPNEDGTDTVSNSVIWYTYKVKLNDEANKNVGVHSEVPLNDPTSFMYGIENGEQTEMHSAAFPIPEATYAYSSIQTTWQATDADGRTFTISQSDLAALNPDIASNPEAVEKVISDYSSAAYIPAFTQQYQFNPPVIPIEGSDNYYRYVETVVTADGQTLGGVEDVDATQPVAYQVVHKYELVEANEVYIDVTKSMIGRDFMAGDTFDFTFEISAVSPNAPMPEGTVGNSITITQTPNSGNTINFTFDKIVFTQAGVYEYTIRELEGTVPNIVYDTTPRTMVVTVVDNGGKLTATYTIDGVANAATTIVNSLETGTLKIEKTEVISHLPEHQEALFPFLINIRNVSNRPITGAYTLVNPDGTTSTVNFTNGYATVSLKAGQSVVIEGLPDGATYTVTEGAVGGFTPTATGNTGAIVAHEERVASFSNTYAASGRYQFFGTKMVQDMTLAVGQFTFFVTDEDGNVVARGTNTSDGSVFFDTLEFTHEDVGQKTYHIAETIGNQEGVIYDRTVYTVTLTIADNGDGTLSIADDLDGSKITFLNKYITNQLTVSKNVDGNMGNKYKEFSFTLTVPDQAGQIINISTDGGATFTETALNAQGMLEFTMMHGDNLIFYPVGGTYTVTETDNGSYTTTYSLNGAAAATGTSVTSTIPNDGSNTVRFTNTYNVGVPTGVNTPVAVALVGIAMAMALLAIVYAGRRWRFLEE